MAKFSCRNSTVRHRIHRPTIIGLHILSLILLLTLLPARRGRVVRDTTREIALLENAECEYNGIKTTLGEMTKAYALQAYEKASFIQWEARPNPENPETEALVTGIFTTEGIAPPPGKEAINRDILKTRRKGVPSLAVTWRVRTLAGIDIVPHNSYARDAVAVYRQTVDAFIERMVVITHATLLRAGPGSGYTAVKPVAFGTVLLQEGQQDQWIRVRLPSTTTEGWVGKENVQTVK